MFKRYFIFGLVFFLLLLGPLGSEVQAALDKNVNGVASEVLSTTDHSRFVELDKSFASGPEVTRACLKCHNQAAGQMHKSIHWTWECNKGDEHWTLECTKGDEKGLGKAHIVNNF